LNKKANILFLTVIIVTVLSTVLFYPGKIPYKLEVIGKILPHRDVAVNRGVDGLISVSVNDNLSGTLESSFVTELQRGDAVTFRFHRSIVPGADIAAGDTICLIDSHEIERELVRLRGELDIEKASLRLARTGEKESVIDESRKILESAKEELSEHERILERRKKLYEAGILPYQDYEMTLSRLALYRIEVRKAEAQLETVQTGVKPEEIDLIISRISGIERDIAALTERLSRFTITSPFPGTVLDTSTDGSVVTIGDMSQLCVIMPIKLKNRSYIKKDQPVEFTIEGVGETLHGSIRSLGNVVRITRAEQTLMATAILDGNGHGLLAGTITKCDILLEPVTLLEYCTRTINTVFNR